MNAPDDDLRSLAAWYLHDNHRLFWNVPIALSGVLLLLAFVLAQDAADPAKDATANLTELESLRPPRIADDENAAKDYTRAIESRDKESLKAFYKRFTSYQPATGSGAGLDAKELLQYLDKHRDCREHLFSAVGKAKIRWELGYADGMQMQLKHLSPMREMARMLALYSRVCAHNSDHLEAAHALGAIYRMSRHLEEEPILTGYLVSCALQSVADRALEAILYFDTPRAQAALDAYKKNLRRDRDTLPKLKKVLRSEQAFFERMLVQLGTGTHSIEDISMLSETSTRSAGDIRIAALAPLWYGSEKRAAAAGYRYLIEASEQWETIDADVLRLKLFQETKGPFLCGQLMLPVLAEVSNSFKRVEADGQAAALELALLSFRVRTGKYPDTLNQLVPTEADKLPLDPWHQKPWALQYRHEGWKEVPEGTSRIRELGSVHLRLYCFGKNGMDDGGKCSWVDVAEQINTNNADDAAFRLPCDLSGEQK
ncbi:MAG: hypothetical protein HY291_13780 [Planctomycetes bacterium]|nr:hypothetical protein [Planctomycetota bacterium]